MDKNSTFIVDIFKAYALAFFMTIVLGNVLVSVYNIFEIDILNTLGTLMISMACPMIAASVGMYLGNTKIQIISLFIIGAIGQRYGNNGLLVTFGLAVVLGVIFKVINGAAKGFALIAYPLMAIIVGIIGFKVGIPVADKLYIFIINQFVKWNAAAQVSGSIFYYLIIAVVSGFLFISPIGMWGLIPMLTASDIGNNLANPTIIAICCGVMSFMIGFAVIAFKDNDIGTTIGLLIGTPTLMFGNFLHNMMIALSPMVAACVSCYVAVRFLGLTGSISLMELGNCCFIGLIDLFKNTSLMNFACSILIYLIIPAGISFVVNMGIMKLSLVKAGHYKVEL